jgi:hypothetical protein
MKRVCTFWAMTAPFLSLIRCISVDNLSPQLLNHTVAAGAHGVAGTKRGWAMTPDENLPDVTAE